MQHAPRKRPDIERVNAFAQSLRLWTMELIAYLAALVGVKYRPRIKQAVRSAKACVFLHAVNRRACGRWIMKRHWRGARPGFRYAFKRSRLRALLRGVKIRDLAELRAALDDMEPAIARMMRHIARTSVQTRLVAVAPARARLAPAAADPAPDGADTS